MKQRLIFVDKWHDSDDTLGLLVFRHTNIKNVTYRPRPNIVCFCLQTRKMYRKLNII